MLTYQASGASDVGLRRQNNEDAFLVRPEIGLLALADGMGGAAAGEVASAIFVGVAGEVFGATAPASVEGVSALVRKVFSQAHERMIDHVAGHPDSRGMGCTAELLVFSGDRYTLGHLGDSRSYLLRGGELSQITRDHSLVQQMVDRGSLTAAQAKHHPMKGVLLRALGADMELTFDELSGRVLHNDLFLLCSDGLTDMLDDDAIRATLATHRSLAEKVKLLIDAAKSAGGVDNITAVLCQAE